MTRADASRLLRQNVLADSTILVAGADSGDSFGRAVSARCGELGAALGHCVASAHHDHDAAFDAAVEQELAGLGAIDMLVVDAASLFAGAGGSAQGASPAPDAQRAMLVDALQASWNITHAVANRAFLARTPEGTGGRAGRIVYLAPAPDAGEHAEAARAGLENLARTLSIEWARHGITLVTIAPGAATEAGEVAALSAYLASPAGAYFSGCLLDLRGPPAR